MSDHREITRGRSTREERRNDSENCIVGALPPITVKVILTKVCEALVRMRPVAP